MPGERFVYLNGEIIEENSARISPFDRGFLWGDGVYEVTPCFDGKLYRLDDHIDRLYRSLKYVRIEMGISQAEMKQATLATLESNLCRLEEGAMYRVGHWVTRGYDDPSMTAGAAGSRFGVHILAARERRVFRRAVSERRTPGDNAHEAQSARVHRDESQGDEQDEPDSGGTRCRRIRLALLDARRTRERGGELERQFLHGEGRRALDAAREEHIAGVTRIAVFELAARLGIAVEERDITTYDLAQAEEYFITSSAICAMPVREIDSFQPSAPVPGPVTQRLIEAFVEDTGYDFREQVKEKMTEGA